MKKSQILFCTGILIYSFSCNAQSNTPSVINALGGFADTGYYRFEWSVGELALIDQMSSGDNLVVTNGFLQPYTIFPSEDNTTPQFSIEEIKVFPNPASSYIEINFFTKQKGKISLTLFDAIGKKIYVKELQGNGVDLVERIPVSGYANGTYSLYVNLNASGGFISKKGLYKIIKIN